MRRILPALVALTALVLAACGGRGAAEPASPGSSTSASEPDPMYEADGMVVDDGTGVPRLCLGATLAMLPPRCDGIPLRGWDWRAVAGKETARGTTWGTYHVVGAYDGETFAVSAVGPSNPDPSSLESDPDFASPCSKLARRWAALDPAGFTQEEARAATAYARSHPDYVTSWVTHLEPVRFERSPVIVNVVVTGDAERHEAEIRRVWNGPLCVVERDVPTARELGRLRKEVEAGLGDLGLEMLWSSGPDVEPVIEIGVVVDAEGKAQAALDERYGAGVVRLFPALTPVS
jgi:hypothetical protein